jgi:small-conductance mechanosensitive channel
MGISDRTVEAIVTAGTGAALIVLVRSTLKHALDRYVAHAAERRPPGEVAGLQTRLSVLLRVIVAALAAILAWQVLSVFPETHKLGTALLASSAVLAVFAGLAFSVPLGNLGAGVMLAFTQPVRLGDRVSVNDVTGEVEQIALIHTVLLTDDDRRIYIPNSQMVSSIVVNRTIKDPRRLVTVKLPIALGAPVDRARASVLDAIGAVEQPIEDVSLLLADVSEGISWLTLSAFAPPGTNVAALGGELRERAITALAREQLLPA